MLQQCVCSEENYNSSTHLVLVPSLNEWRQSIKQLQNLAIAAHLLYRITYNRVDRICQLLQVRFRTCYFHCHYRFL